MGGAFVPIIFKGKAWRLPCEQSPSIFSRKIEGDSGRRVPGDKIVVCPCCMGQQCNSHFDLMTTKPWGLPRLFLVPNPKTVSLNKTR